MALYNPNHDKDRLYLWLDAADISDGVGQPDNNAKVERWTDKSPNKYVFTAASTGQMPTYLTSQPSNDGASKPSVYSNKNLTKQTKKQNCSMHTSQENNCLVTYILVEKSQTTQNIPVARWSFAKLTTFAHKSAF